MNGTSSLIKAKCQLETSLKGKLAELQRQGYVKQEAFGRLLGQIAPHSANFSLKETDISAAMQVYNLEREYAINALTISNELISLRRNQGMDLLQALEHLQQRVKAMRITRKAHSSHACAKGSASSSPVRKDDEGHVEKRRRLSKSPCKSGSSNASTGGSKDTGEAPNSRSPRSARHTDTAFGDSVSASSLPSPANAAASSASASPASSSGAAAAAAATTTTATATAAAAAAAASPTATASATATQSSANAVASPNRRRSIAHNDENHVNRADKRSSASPPTVHPSTLVGDQAEDAADFKRMRRERPSQQEQRPR